MVSLWTSSSAAKHRGCDLVGRWPGPGLWVAAQNKTGRMEGNVAKPSFPHCC